MKLNFYYWHTRITLILNVIYIFPKSVSNFWPSKLKRTKGLLFRYTSGAEAKLVQLELSNAQSFIWGHARILQCTLRNLSHLPISSFQIKTALQFYQNDENVELEKSDLADCDNFSFIICDSFNLFWKRFNSNFSKVGT